MQEKKCRSNRITRVVHFLQEFNSKHNEELQNEDKNKRQFIYHLHWISERSLITVNRLCHWHGCMHYNTIFEET
jgi:hypothetical protein